MLFKIKENFKYNIKDALILMSLPVLLYFFVGPLSVYNSNLDDFSFEVSSFFYTIAIAGLVLFILGTLFISVLPKKAGLIFKSLLFYAGIMSLIQDTFLNVKLSESDGSNMNWDNMRSTIVVNTIIWVVVLIAVIVLMIKLKEKIRKPIVAITGFASAIELITFISLFITALNSGVKNEGVQYGLVGDTQFQVASNNNVIVFVVDTYGSYQFEQGIKNNPDLINGLEDFTYYDNADSSYFRTFPSMTHMLTGVDMDLNMTNTEYFDAAWNNENAINFYGDIHQAGYKFYVYSNGGKPVYGDAKGMYGLIDNAKEVTYGTDKTAAVNRMAKISIYKYCPYLMKERFEVESYKFSSIMYYTNAGDCLCGNAMYYDALKNNGLSIGTDENAVIIQHIDGTHKPYETSSECMTDYDANLQTTQEGIMTEIKYYISLLKENGLYDNATIIITADHSSWTTDETADDPQIVYLVKKQNESHNTMQTNHAPISHDDFRATILDIIGVGYSQYGQSVFDYAEDEERERIIVNQEFNGDYPKVSGNPSNVYTKYSYKGSREDITNKAREDGPDEIYEIKSKK